MSNKVVEASGGILWQRETAAVEFIQAGTNCTKEEAREALKVWRKDGRVSSKSDPTARESLDVLRDLKIWWRDGRPPESTSTYEDSINMHELRALLARPKLETPSGADLGASPERRKKKAPRLSAVVAMLRKIYPSEPPAPDREVMRKAVEDKIGSISLATLDRARKEAWPAE